MHGEVLLNVLDRPSETKSGDLITLENVSFKYREVLWSVFDSPSETERNDLVRLENVSLNYREVLESVIDNPSETEKDANKKCMHDSTTRSGHASA